MAFFGVIHKTRYSCSLGPLSIFSDYFPSGGTQDQGKVRVFFVFRKYSRVAEVSSTNVNVAVCGKCGESLILTAKPCFVYTKIGICTEPMEDDRMRVNFVRKGRNYLLLS